MKSSEEIDDMDKDSEFDSEAEDIEFRLYQQLYFETNPDETEADIKSTSPIEQQHEGEFNPNKTHDEQIAQLHYCQLNTLETKSLTPPHDLPTAASETNEAESSQFDNFICIDTEEGAEVTLADFTANIDAKNTDNCSIGQKREIHGNCVPEVSFSDVVHLKKDAISLQSVRERLSSTCSDGSIPGSVPLDALYCNLVTTAEQKDDTIENRLIMKSIDGNDQERIEEKSKKRKRKISCSDDEEDSRCNKINSAASKSTVNEDDVLLLEEDSSSDDIHVLPPPKQNNPEILTLESSSDSEEKTRIRNGTCIKSSTNKYRKIEKPPSLTSRNKEENSRSVHQISEIQEEHRSKERDVATAGSESDSCDVDMPEATKGTDLTLNIDQRLTGWIKTITKDAPTKKRKKSITTNPQNKRSCSSVDFTKGRPNTTTRPSCEKWTQSMANFYDSDVSDEFDVSEIHRQQSGSPVDWPLIAADYQITQRRRYYNVAEKCRRCRQEGHTTNKCPRVPVCHLCSRTDHSQRRFCPENCCFKCGGEPHYFCPYTDLSRICSLCSSPGHLKHFCPDLWRRFHLTTNGMTAKTPVGHLMRPLEERYCYSCGRQGHYGHECRTWYQKRLYAYIPQSIVSYSSPVNVIDNNFVVNVDGSPSSPADPNVTTIHIRSKDVGRIIGKRGAVVKSVIKDSGAHVRIVHEEKPMVLLFGPSEARLRAQEIIEILLGKKSNGNVDVTQPLNNINNCNVLANDVSDNVPMDASDVNDSVLMDANDIDDNVPIDTSVSNSSQTLWNLEFSSETNRKKNLVQSKIKVFMKNVRTKKYLSLTKSIRKLKKFKLRKEATPSEQLSEMEKKHLYLVAMHALGNSKYGNKREIQEKLIGLLSLVESCPSSTVSEDICTQLTDTVQPFLYPPLEKLDELLQYAETNTAALLKHMEVSKVKKKQITNKLNKHTPSEKKNTKVFEKESKKNKKKIKAVKTGKLKNDKIKAVKKGKAKNDKKIEGEEEKGESKNGKKIEGEEEKEKAKNGKKIEGEEEKVKAKSGKKIKAVKKGKAKNGKKIKVAKKGKAKNGKKIEGEEEKGKAKNGKKNRR